MSNEFTDDEAQRKWFDEQRANEEPEDLDSAALAEPVDVDFKGIEFGPSLPVGRYPMRVIDVKRKVSKSESSTPYAELTLEVIAGALTGKKLPDRLMLEGPGRARLKPFLSAAGLMTRQQDAVRIKLSDFLGKLVWVSVVHEKRTWDGEERTQAKVSFSGYESLDKFPLPDKHDPFQEENQIRQPEPVAAGPDRTPQFPSTQPSQPAARGDWSA